MRPAILLCLALGATLSSSALAQSLPADVSDATTERARKLHVEASELFEREDFAGAYAAYAAAYGLKKHPQIAGNLGDCEVRLGRYRDAAEHLATFLSESTRDVPRDQVERAKTLFEQARAHVGALRVTAPSAGAEVFVDGKSVGVAPLREEIFVEPGSHLIEARMGMAMGIETIEAREGETRTVALNLTPAAEAKAETPEPRASTKTTVAWTAGTVGVAAGLAGAGLLGMANYRHSELVDCAGKDCSAIDRDAKTFGWIGVGVLSVAGAAGVTALIAAVLPEPKGERRRVEGAIVVVPGSAGVSVRGSF